MEVEKKKKFLEGLNTYYKLKSEYEEANLKNRNKIMKNQNLSWKEKRAEYKKLKPKCINCKRPVGSIFSSVYNPDENGRKLMAVCGDRANPCPLNITINLGETTTYFDDITILEKEIATLKNKIIKEKNDLIFGYISSEDAVKSFDDLTEELNITLSSYELTLDGYTNVVDNSKKNETIKNDQLAIYQHIQAIKNLVSQYERTENVQFIREAIVIYINQLITKIDELNNLKYPYRVVVYDSDDDTHHLNQKRYTIDEIETNYAKHDIGVEFLQIGTLTSVKNRRERKVPAKPVVNPNAEPFALKMNVKPKIVIESDEEEEDEEDIPAPHKEIDVLFEDDNGETYLFKAVQSGDIAKVQEQIDNGADIHKKTKRGETPLYAAVSKGNIEIVNYLLDHGAEADINIAANWGTTPLQEATKKNYLEIAEVLKNKGGK
jgi:hypothetical protein